MMHGHVTMHHCSVTWSQSTVRHCNDARSTVTGSSFNNDERHVTPFRPISEAARSLSCDNELGLHNAPHGWWRGTEVERRSQTGKLSLSCAQPAAEG